MKKASHIVAAIVLALVSAGLLLPPMSYGQGSCPACSNPAILTNARLEEGLAIKGKGDLRVSLHLTRSEDLEGGHLETRSLSINGQIDEGPVHRHEVSLDITRFEAVFEYSFHDVWDLWLRIPYSIRRQSASAQFVEEASDEERKSIERNLFIHHRDETYRGMEDLKLLAVHRWAEVWAPGDMLNIAIGASIPTGETEENPYIAGDAGQPHLHIQYGSGTFDPLLELHYTRPLAAPHTLAVYLTGRFPFYENSETYQGSEEMSVGITLMSRIHEIVSLHANLSGSYQGYAYWDDERDINSGLIAFTGMAGATFFSANGTTLSLDLRYPFTQETLSEEGDTFEQGVAVLLNVSRGF